MEIDNPQSFDHIIGINGEILQPKVLAYADVEIAKIQPEPVVWRKTTADEFHLPAGVIGANAGVLRVKVIEIGAWDMTAPVSHDVAHGLTFSKIRMVQAIISNDAGDGHYPLHTGATINDSTPQGNIWVIDATNVSLIPLNAGFFDSVDFDDGVMNRGWLTLWYED